jgi:hypothetical protein
MCSLGKLHFTMLICILILLFLVRCRRELAPTAKIVLFRETAFTRETPCKKHIYVDKAQEKIIGITRYECREQVLPGIDTKVDEMVLNMEELLVKKQSINAMKGLQVHQSSGPFNESSVPVDHVYVATGQTGHASKRSVGTGSIYG